MSSKVYVVNTGIITAIGDNTQECLQSLLSEKSGISKAEYLETAHKDEFPVGEVKADNQKLASRAGVNERWPRTALLSAIAVKECITPYADNTQNYRTGFFSANTVGGMDLTENVYGDIVEDITKVDTQNFINHECGAVTDLVAKHFGINDYVTTISTACSSSANSIMMAVQMIDAGMLDIAIAGGADALSKFTLNGFNTLMILDKEPCQPFDENRRGLNLGEGAGYLLLMSEQAMQECNAKAICTISGYANANDAYHQTASSPDGTGNTLAMKNALAKARLQPTDINYINLHGTGTDNNDSSESIAVTNIFGSKVPYASTTKAYTGHTLGAAGGVEAVFSALAIKHGAIFPTLRLGTQLQSIDWEVVTEVKKDVEVNHVLSNSFGFGGNCSTLIFSKS